MPLPKPSRAKCEHAIETLKRLGTVADATRELDLPRSTFISWLEIGRRHYGLVVPEIPKALPKGRRELEIVDGVGFVGSDAHYWPGEPSTAHRAFVRFIAREKHKKFVVLNGDAYDFPGISRHPPIGWVNLPTPAQELEIVAERLGEIAKAAGKIPKFFPAGNHDLRFETLIAKNVPELKACRGTSLVDNTPDWEPCWALFVNDSHGGAVIKHRARSGIHGPHNNTLWAGRTIITGHAHSQKVMPVTDFNGTRWGVDTGCLAEIYGPQFEDYLEGGFRNWRSGFARLKFVGGKLLTPELIRVVEPGIVEFRGELIEV